MRRALDSLLSSVIDYAGLFPPAKLEMTPSVDAYLNYMHGDERWILGRFVCSVGKLPTLARELAEHAEEPYVPVSVIGQGGEDRRHWENNLAHDAEAMNKFLEDAEGHAEIQTYEVRAYDHAHMEMFLLDLRGFSDADVFLELPWAPQMDESLALIAESEWLNAKVRTGGLDASAFPSSEQLAGFLQQCAHLELRYKLTAGLHHPLPTQDKATGGRMHGFLNVLCAAALLEGNELSRVEVAAILDEPSIDAFNIDSSGIRWKEFEASQEACDLARERLVSFGSCSIEEPIQELEALGIGGSKVAS